MVELLVSMMVVYSDVKLVLYSVGLKGSSSVDVMVD